MRGKRAGRLACVTMSERKIVCTEKMRFMTLHSFVESKHWNSFTQKRKERERWEERGEVGVKKDEGDRKKRWQDAGKSVLFCCEKGDDRFTALVLLLPRLGIIFARIRIQWIEGR